ncbi:hypothetical protein V1260_11345 [Brachybacterium sp. J144]|uniref:hypothetical protein n=1 Tax=Brachybacterium sp. J144 TaxID=3116487 RepID=UPI002E75E8DA|nr:hypothetical protein [Brachybacterium sp. J144]MEE1651376.1 hypothetical protein [Brachybacterium sp. J144]
MNDILTHAQLHRSGRGELLLKLAEMTASDPASYAAHQALARFLDLTERDALFQLGKLREADLVVSSGRMSGGWRPTPEGRRIAAGLRASLEEGPLRLEHTMRAILAELKAAGGEATRDDWLSWDLHDDALTPVLVEEREQALDLLEEAKYITTLNALQASHLRVEITSRGRTALMRPEAMLFDSLFPHGPTTNVDQRVGIQTQSFHNNGGAVQTGDHSAQYITITNTQIERVTESIAATRAVLAHEDLDELVRSEVSAVVDELEVAANQKAEVGVLHTLITKATMAAAGAAGTAAGGAVIQSLAAIGAALA